MKNKNTSKNLKKRRIIIAIPTVFISWLLIISCYWGPYAEDLRVYLFHPATDVSGDLYPFFYSTQTYNENWNMDTTTIPDENIEEWYNYFNQRYERGDILNLIYNTKLEDLQKLAKRNDYYYYQNKFGSELKETRNYRVIDYLLFAKKVEVLLSEADPWYGDNYDVPALEKLIEESKTKVEETEDLILKQRYAYQAIVMMRYLTMTKEAVEYYEQIFSKIQLKEQSIIKYWALSHTASCMYNDKKKRQLAYLEVFTNSTAKKRVSYQSIDKKYLDSIKSELLPEERTNFLILKEIQNPGKSLEGLKEIAKNDMNSENFNTLLIREVNKIEDWILTLKYTHHEPAITFWKNWIGDTTVINNYNRDLKYLGNYISFMESNLKTGKVENKALWELILSHLYFIYDTPQMAVIHLNKAEKLVETTSELNQLRTTRILVSLISSKKFDSNMEAKIWEDISWLLIDKNYNQEKERNFTNLMFALQKNYHNKKIYDKSALFMAYELNRNTNYYLGNYTRWWNFSKVFFYLDRYATVEQVENFVQIVENKNKTILEKFLLENFKYKKEDYLELMGTIALRQNDFETAKKYYSQISDNYWNTTNYKYYTTSNPFNFYKYQKTINNDYFRYSNKLKFVEILQKKIKEYEMSKGDEKYKLALEIGNAYYNMSFFGKNWAYVCYGKSDMGGRLNRTTFNTYVNDNYMHCTTAIKYYESALKYAEEKDKPEILFIMASVQNDSQKFEDQKTEDPSINDRDKRYSGDYEYYKDRSEYKENLYIKELKTDFPTDYNYYLEECPGIEYF